MKLFDGAKGFHRCLVCNKMNTMALDTFDVYEGLVLCTVKCNKCETREKYDVAEKDFLNFIGAFGVVTREEIADLQKTKPPKEMCDLW